MLNKIFDIDNPVWKTFSNALDLVILNIMFLLCCLPVVTIGGSITALYYTTLRMTSGRMTYVIREFFKSFKENFKQGLLCEVLIFDAGVILAVPTYFSFVSNAYLGKVLFVVLDVLAFGVVTFVFPVLAKFQMQTKELFRTSALMAVRYVPYAVLNVIVLGVSGFALYNGIFVLLVFLLVGFALVAVLQSVWFNRIFANFVPDTEKQLDAKFHEEEEIARKENRK